jgi:hypothetical protein
VHYAYFGVKLGDQDKSWAPHKVRVCYVCVEDMRKWSKGKEKTFRFGVSVIWREPKNHSDDCYFCCYDVKGYNSKNKKVKALPTTGNCFKYLCKRFPHLSEAKHKEDAFVGPDI